MPLVVDTNILISALLAKSTTYELIVTRGLELFVPEKSIEEINNNREELRNRMEVSETEFESVLILLIRQVEVIEREQYKKFEDKATEISPHLKDMPFFALAMSRKLPLWTNEKRLKNQKEVIVYNTKEIIEIVLFK